VAAGLGHLASGIRKSLVVDNTSYASPIHGDEKYLNEAISDLATFLLREPDNQTCFLTAASHDGIASVQVYGDAHTIPGAARQGIFDAFSGQMKDKPARAAHRVGLALAKIIVEAHHGSITMADMPGAGTAFVVEFPTHWHVREPRRSE